MKIDGTDINYPVVQGKDNEFYHEHKEITLYLENQKYQYEVAAMYVTNVAQSGGYVPYFL